MSAPNEAWARWRVRAGYPVALVYALLAAPTTRFILAGMAVAVAGLAIRAAAAGQLRKHEALATSGPYAYTRNPLYFGSALLAAGFVVAGRSWPAAVLVLGYFSIFYAAVMRLEEAGLRERYGAEFEAYAAQVPLFWPRLGAAKGGTEAFSGQRYQRNREYQAALGTAAGFLLLWLKMLWWG